MERKENIMATTTKKATASIDRNPVEAKDVDDSLAKENELLKKQMEAMQAQMDMLAKQMATGNTIIAKNSKGQEKNIQFINMVPGTLILRGTQVWKIEGQFNSRSFMEREARIILNNMQNTIRSGYVYIADNDFVQENDLGEVYANMLSDEQLRNLFNKNFNEIVEIYKTVPKAQQDIIISMIKEKKASGAYVDANILIKIGELCGQDLITNIEYEDEG